MIKEKMLIDNSISIWTQYFENLFEWFEQIPPPLPEKEQINKFGGTLLTERIAESNLLVFFLYKKVQTTCTCKQEIKFNT